MVNDDVDMLKAPAISCFFLLHEVPAAGDVTEHLSLSAMGSARDVLVESSLDVLPLVIAGFLPAAAANRPIISIVADVASIPGHSD